MVNGQAMDRLACLLLSWSHAGRIRTEAAFPMGSHPARRRSA
jgi:hypothetical protein